MVVSPARALMAARMQLLWNLAHRGRGAVATIAAVVIAVVAVACLVPPFVMFHSFGSALGQDLTAEASPAMTWLCGLVALIVFGLGGVAGLRHRAGFDRELLRVLPLRPVQILVGELPFNLIDTIPILGFTFLAGLGVGLARAMPGSGLQVALVVAQDMLCLLLVQQLVGACVRLAGRSRIGAAVAGLVVVLVASVAVLYAGEGFEGALERVMGVLPTSAGWQAVRASAAGVATRSLALHLAGLAFTAALFAVTAWLQLLELRQEPKARIERRKTEKLWTFRRPAAGVARLLVAEVLGARAGQLLLALPVFCTTLFVLAADILRRSAVGRDFSGFLLTIHLLLQKAVALPLFVLVPPAVILCNRQLWLNQFAWEGAGVKTLFLAPVRTVEILRGKLAGLLLLQMPQALVACAPLLRLRLPEGWDLVTGLCAAAMAATVLGTFGHVLSARHPRVLAEQGERTGGTDAGIALTVTGAVLAMAAVVYGVVRGLAGLPPWAPALLFALMTVVVLAAHRALAPRMAASVDSCREVLAETLG